jgi:hypothetical protein
MVAIFTIKMWRITEYLDKEPHEPDRLIAKIIAAERSDGNPTPEEEMKRRILNQLKELINEGKIEIKEGKLSAI